MVTFGCATEGNGNDANLRKFEKSTEAAPVLWWLPTGHQPDFVETRERFEHLRKHGSTEYVFLLADTFPALASGADHAPLD